MTLALFLALIFAVLNILDVISTVRALGVPGNREANPILRWLMDRTSNTWIVLKLAVAALVGWLLWGNVLLMAPLCLIYAIVVYNNFKLAR